VYRHSINYHFLTTDTYIRCHLRYITTRNKDTPLQCCGSGMYIPDPGFERFHPGYRIPGQKDSGSRIRIKEFRYFTQKIVTSSRIYDPGFSSRIRILDLDFYLSRIPDPGSRGQKGIGSRIRIRNTAPISGYLPNVLFSRLKGEPKSILTVSILGDSHHSARHMAGKAAPRSKEG
jgi:hypothetical protein